MCKYVLVEVTRLQAAMYINNYKGFVYFTHDWAMAPFSNPFVVPDVLETGPYYKPVWRCVQGLRFSGETSLVVS